MSGLEDKWCAECGSPLIVLDAGELCGECNE